jgi:hypothetical protein
MQQQPQKRVTRNAGIQLDGSIDLLGNAGVYSVKAKTDFASVVSE